MFHVARVGQNSRVLDRHVEKRHSVAATPAFYGGDVGAAASVSRVAYAHGLSENVVSNCRLYRGASTHFNGQRDKASIEAREAIGSPCGDSPYYLLGRENEPRLLFHSKKVKINLQCWQRCRCRIIVALEQQECLLVSDYHIYVCQTPLH
jgi:hypothetical protein